jgi:gliding motility-associated-like protein
MKLRTYCYLILAVLLGGLKAIAQPLPCPPVNTTLVAAGADPIICPGACANLVAFDTTSLKSTTSYTVGNTTYLPYPYNFGTTVLLGVDDQWSQVVPLPFDFCFFGQKYNQCVLGSNGQLSFNVANAGGFCNWAFNAGIPAINATNGAEVLNAIMSPYHDIDPAVQGSGQMRYATFGVAPCRTFVVSWDSIPMFSCNSVMASQQIVLYETTYAVDIFIREKSECLNWNGGLAILGIQNATGSLQYTAPGKNGTQWTSNNEGYRFTPSGPVTKTYQWLDVATGQVISNSPNVTVCPPDTNQYVLQVKFSSQCDSIVLSDTVQVNVDKAAVSSFTFDIQYGCDQDTVIFTNNSINNTFNRWDFGDGTGDTAANPIHIYTQQGTYNVKLVVSNGNCFDSTIQLVDTRHPLDAAFTVDDDSVCQGAMVSFTNTSTYTTIEGPATFNWYFGDGGTATGVNTTHVFDRTGVYNVMMTVTDFVPCSDTSYHIVVVDSMPFVRFTVSDSVICEGKAITFAGDYLTIGNTGLDWDFGEGNRYMDKPQMLHSYDSAGVYSVTFTASYRICPDASFTKNVEVKPFPQINLGPDTTMCPNTGAILIGDFKNAGNPLAAWNWNTGDTGPTIQVRHPGIYTAKVQVEGCLNSDSIEVKKDCYIDVPNTFTPNGDGVNDYFLPRQLLSKGVVAFKMSVFNRWGQDIFQTTALDGRGWDGNFNGKPQPMGVYVYLIDATLKSGAHEKYQGNVTLMR